MPGNFLHRPQWHAGATEICQKCPAHRMCRCTVQAQSVEGFAKSVVRLDALDVAAERVAGGKEPAAQDGAVAVVANEVAQFCVDGDVAVDGVFLLQALDFEDIADAAVFGEDLFASEANDFADTQSGVNAEREKQTIARCF